MVAAATQGKPSEKTPNAVVDYSKFVPAGFKTATNDVAGYWSREIDPVIDFIPREVTLVDSQQDTRKPSALIVGELCRDQMLVNSEKEPVEGKKGDLVGVWYGHGMSAIADKCGVRVVMWQKGKEEWKKLKGRPAGQSPMKTYEIKFDPKAKGSKLPIVADRRDESKDVPTVFTPVSVAAGTPEPF